VITLITLALVFILIAVRRIGSLQLAIWQIMGAGALLVLVTGQIAPARALAAINGEVMLFLAGMFVLGRALEMSGYLAVLEFKLLRRTRTAGQLVFGLLLTMGLGSALLMNDTVAVIGTPLVVWIARRQSLEPKLLLLTLAFAITIGSVMSPIGNPQNLLIALQTGLANPFVVFLKWLAVPTIANLLLAGLVLRFFYRKEFRQPLHFTYQAETPHNRLVTLVKTALGLVGFTIMLKIGVVIVGLRWDLPLTLVALAAALPVLAGSPQRWQILKTIDWATLLFFAAMFILMQSVWDTGFFQHLLGALLKPSYIMAAGIVLSQFISNVPLVALLLPAMQQSGAEIIQLMTLAAGSTLAGNLTILGAASNVIIIQMAERMDGGTLTFVEFIRIGALLTLLNALLVMGWIMTIAPG